MTNRYELPQDLLHEVIMRTIEINNLSNQIIRVAFGLSLKWNEENESQPILLNQNEINRFNSYFLDNFGSSSKAELLLEIYDDMVQSNKKEINLCQNFRNKLIDFYKIRNIFAHNIYPKDLKGMTRLESKESHWIPLNKQHKELYEELKIFLYQLLY